MSERSLKTATNDFFKLYWNESKITQPRPKWSTWHLSGNPPEAEMGGCYAIFKGDSLLYVGVAVTEGKNATKTGKKYGLLNRLKRHVLRKTARGSTEYIPITHKGRNKWQGMTCICLIAFPDQHRHLAAALELYLIGKLRPLENAQSRWHEEEKSASDQR